MSKYTLKNLNEIAEIDGELAKCKSCGEIKSVRGISTHFFRKHTEEGLQHTEKVKNFLKDHTISNEGRKIRCVICDLDIGCSAFTKHVKLCTDKKLLRDSVIGKACEACNSTITEFFGSGRFCSSSCARGGYSRPNKKEASMKTSLKLRGRKVLNKETGQPLVKDIENVCFNCKKSFISRKIEKKYCSAKCYNQSDEKREMMSLSMKKIIERGNPFPKRIKCNFIFNDKNLRCDSRLEWAFLSWVTKNFDVIVLKRSEIKINYTLDSKERLFNPDFEFVTKNGIKYLAEVKSVQSPKNPAWIQYNRESEAKNLVLRSFCKETGFEPLWFTQKTDTKFYRKACLEFDNTIRKSTV